MGNRFCPVKWKNPAVDWLLEHRPELLKKKKPPTTYYFAKRGPNETFCEKITTLNILSNQFFGTETWGGGGCAPKFSFPPPPAPTPPPMILLHPPPLRH